VALQVLDVSFACFTDINDFPSSGENADNLLVSHTSISNCCALFYCFTVGRGVREQPQVNSFHINR